MSVTISFQGASEELSLNLANSNFYDFFTILGLSLDSEYCGSEDPTVIYNLCKSFDPMSLIVDAYSEGNCYYCGRTLEQVTRYKWNLMNLAKAAIKAGKRIYWG
jgi:hypothetical protein